MMARTESRLIAPEILFSGKYAGAAPRYFTAPGLRCLRTPERSEPCQRARHAPRGFTMIEVLISVAILAIVAAIAVPMVLSSVERYKVEASAHNVAQMLLEARTEAVKTHRRISTIFVAPAGNNDTAFGIDLNGDGTLQVSEPQTMLARGVSFWQNDSPSVPVGTNLPSDYSGLVAPAAFVVTFSPQGTVVVNNGGTWQLASSVIGLCVTDGSTVGAAGSDSWLIAVTPAAHVQLFRWLAGTGWVAQ